MPSTHRKSKKSQKGGEAGVWDKIKTNTQQLKKLLAKRKKLLAAGAVVAGAGAVAGYKYYKATPTQRATVKAFPGKTFKTAKAKMGSYVPTWMTWKKNGEPVVTTSVTPPSEPAVLLDK